MMDHGQIVREYRASKNKAESVKVLAELNGTTAEEIRRILIEGGVKPEELPRKPRNKNATPEEIRRENADDELSRAIQALRRIAEGLLTERAALDARQKKMEEAVSGLLAAIKNGRND